MTDLDKRYDHMRIHITGPADHHLEFFRKFLHTLVAHAVVEARAIRRPLPARTAWSMTSTP